MSPAVDHDTERRFFALYEAFASHDIDAVIAEMSDDVEWPTDANGSYVVGRAALQEYLRRQWERGAPNATPRSVDAIGASDIRVVALRDGAEVQHLYSLDADGRIARMEIRV